MYYVPKFPNGKPVPLFWPIQVTRRLNHVYWPLKANASQWMRVLDRVGLLLGFAIFQYYNEAELRYLWENFSNIDVVLSGVPTYVVLVETMFRGFYMGLSKHRLQQLLQRFYAEIYVEETKEKQSYQLINRLLLPTKFFVLLYVGALCTIALFPIIASVVMDKKETLYKMSFKYDITPNYIYIPLTLAGVYVGFIVATVLIVEGYLVSATVYHLHARFILLRRDLNNRIELLSKSNASQQNIAVQMQHEIIATIKCNVNLVDFATQMQHEFTARFFTNFLFSGVLVCALCFKTYTNPTESIAFVVWMLAKILEMLCMGHVGSTLRDTTDGVSAMYYECGWEKIIERSANAAENVNAMKILLTAMEFNQKPIILSGLGFFTVTLDAVLVMLKAAGSLFSCLIAVR